MRFSLYSIIVLILTVLVGACSDQDSDADLNRVPNVVGSEESFARGVIVGAGLGVEVSRSGESGSPGVVLGQIPAAGSMVESTTVVTLVVPAEPITTVSAAPTTSTTRPTITTTTVADSLDWDEITERIRRLDLGLFD